MQELKELTILFIVDFKTNDMQQQNFRPFRNPKTDYSMIDICTKTKVIGMPAGQIMGMVKRMSKSVPLEAPVTLDVLKKATDNYIQIASIQN